MTNKTREITGDVPGTESYIEDLGVGSPKFFDFEKPKLRDPKFVYRWVNIDNVPLMRTRHYVAVDSTECARIKPYYGEFKDGAWHLFDGGKSHMVLMRCPKSYFEKRREYYGNIAKDNIENDTQALAEIGRQSWKKGDSIGPNQIIIDSRAQNGG